MHHHRLGRTIPPLNPTLLPAGAGWLGRLLGHAIVLCLWVGLFLRSVVAGELATV